jgi:hypothetical protein
MKKIFAVKKRQLKIKAYSIVYPFVYNRQIPGIFMWHQGRCGSTVLANLLNQHPNIDWRGEIFEYYARHRMKPSSVEEEIKYIRAVTGKNLPGIEIKGLPCQHLNQIKTSLQQFAEILNKCGFNDCIFLSRKNILRKLISAQIVVQGLYNSFHLSVDSELKLSGLLTIDLQRVSIQGKNAPLLDMVKYIDEESEKSLCTLRNYFRTLPLSYEEDIESNPKAAYQKSCSFLSLPEYEDIEIQDKQVNSMKLKDLITNFDEIEDLLAGTEYEWMLRD